MSYQVLARKWRPQVFDDVVGQRHITRTLQNAIVSERLAHAFLFSGPRGVGKTTTARILAKALNCEKGPAATPCGICNSCVETTAGASVDVIEIDGASNRGIEHIRELREAVKYAPVGGKYKVYVIDEVHMLTNEAFNALLKTLEEPPPHVIFIFATTEPQKIPATIHSRCQRYGFKRIPLQDIIERLRKIALAEDIKITDQGLTMIARAAEGSMRDSQSLLDQAVSYSGVEIKVEDLQVILGTVGQQDLMNFTAALLKRDRGGLLLLVDAFLEQGQDMRQFLSGVVEHIRNLLVMKIASDPGQIVELPAADIDLIKQQAAGAESDHLLMLFDGLSKTLDEMRWSPHQRFTFEVGLIKACSLVPLKPLSEIVASIKELEVRVATGQGVQSASHPASKLAEAPADYNFQPSRETEGNNNPWAEVMRALKSRKPGLASFLSESKLADLSADQMTIGVKGAFQIEQIEKQENRSFIELMIAEVLNRKVRLKVKPLEEEGKPTPKGRGREKKKAEEQDSIVQDALRIFGGEIIEPDNNDE